MLERHLRRGRRDERERFAQSFATLEAAYVGDVVSSMGLSLWFADRERTGPRRTNGAEENERGRGERTGLM